MKQKAKVFFIRENNLLKQIDTSPVVVIEGCRKFVKLHAPGRQYLIPITMDRAIDALGSEKFFRISRSYAVSLPDIVSIDLDVVSIAGMDIPLAKPYYKKLLARVYVLNNAL